MQSLKEKIFTVIDRHISVNAFENWLYRQQDLADRMEEVLIFELFDFNYKHKDSQCEFRRKFLSYFDKTEFTKWKVINNLTTLSQGCNTPMRILEDFYWLYEEEEHLFLEQLAHMMYTLEDAEYAHEVGENSHYKIKKEVLGDIKQEAQALLKDLLTWLERHPDKNIKDFTHSKETTKNISEEKASQAQPRRWWEFWK